MPTEEPNDFTNQGHKKPNKNATKYESFMGFIDMYYNKNRSVNKNALLRLKNKVSLLDVDIKSIISLIEDDKYLERTQKLWSKIIEIDDAKLNNLFRNISRNILLNYNFNGLLSIECNDTNFISNENIENEIRKLLRKTKNISKDKGIGKKNNNLVAILLSFLYLEHNKFEDIYKIYKDIIQLSIKHSRNPSIFLDSLFSPIIYFMYDHEKCSVNKLENENSKTNNENKELHEIIEEKNSIITTLNDSLSENNKKIKLLTEQICELKNIINTSKVDTNNRIENIKGYMISRLSLNINLLKNGLLALQSPNPKPDVAIDHCDRVVDALSNSIKGIREF